LSWFGSGSGIGRKTGGKIRIYIGEKIEKKIRNIYKEGIVEK